ncbi:hypothetical protein [Streptomyces noursei]
MGVLSPQNFPLINQAAIGAGVDQVDARLEYTGLPTPRPMRATGARRR